MTYLVDKNIKAEKTTLEHIDAIKDSLLPELDTAMKVSGGESAYEELNKYVNMSDFAITISAYDKPVCIFGVIPRDNNNGLVFLFTSKLIYKYTKSFFKMSRYFLNIVAEKYDKLITQTQKSFKAAINFKNHMGFKAVDEIKLNDEIFILSEFTGGLLCQQQQ